MLCTHVLFCSFASWETSLCDDSNINFYESIQFGYFRFGCGNSVHVSCIKIWADHQYKSTNEEVIKCPLCRTEFASYKVYIYRLEAWHCTPYHFSLCLLCLIILKISEYVPGIYTNLWYSELSLSPLRKGPRN